MITYLLELLVTLVFMILVSTSSVPFMQYTSNCIVNFLTYLLIHFYIHYVHIHTHNSLALTYTLTLTQFMSQISDFLSWWFTTTTSSISLRFCSAICLSILVSQYTNPTHSFQIFSFPSSPHCFLIQFFLWLYWVILSISFPSIVLPLYHVIFIHIVKHILFLYNKSIKRDIMKSNTLYYFV